MVKKETPTGPSPTGPPSGESYYEVAPGPVASEVPPAASLPLFVHFNPGARVKCTTCFQDEFEGEVMAFDLNSRMLVLKMAASHRPSSHHDVQMLNLKFMKDVQVLSEGPEPTTPVDPPTLNVQRLKTRISQNLERKARQIKAFKAGVPKEGQRLFQTISKTIDEIEWNGGSIVVMNKVTIAPPYKTENIKGASDSKAVLHITKIVEKHLEDERKLLETQTGPTTAQASTPEAPAQAVVATSEAGSSPTSASGSKPSSPPNSGTSSSAQATPTSTHNHSGNQQRNSNGPSRSSGGGQDRRPQSGSHNHHNAPSNNPGRNGPQSGAGGNSRSSVSVEELQGLSYQRGQGASSPPDFAVRPLDVAAC
eukprot:maker-scaffold202_size261857-snap-gene-0.17 protein:Tk10164 transcript:maker-scaffold202_size261857-snap-gene-0.17-mRNA-1 annotation:"protein lsm12 homolog"